MITLNKTEVDKAICPTCAKPIDWDPDAADNGYIYGLCRCGGKIHIAQPVSFEIKER